jgi:hypothetical protein
LAAAFAAQHGLAAGQHCGFCAFGQHLEAAAAEQGFAPHAGLPHLAAAFAAQHGFAAGQQVGFGLSEPYSGIGNGGATDSSSDAASDA